MRKRPIEEKEYSQNTKENTTVSQRKQNKVPYVAMEPISLHLLRI